MTKCIEGRNYKRVKCPCCKNKRLFDMNPDGGGDIEIKCEQCGNIIRIVALNGIINKQKICTEQIGA